MERLRGLSADSGLALSVISLTLDATSPKVGGKGFPVTFLVLPMGELARSA